MGFNDFIGSEKSNIPTIGWGALDSVFFKDLEDRLPHLKEPWFVYAISLSSHTPYTHNKTTKSQLQFSIVGNNLTHDFVESMRYVDKCLSDFIPTLLKKVPNVAIIIFGDHTPGELPLKNQYFSPSKFTTRFGIVELVPIIIILPEQNKNECGKIVSQLDISPTILDIAGINCTYHCYGSSLIQQIPDEIFLPREKGRIHRDSLYNSIGMLHWN